MIELAFRCTAKWLKSLNLKSSRLQIPFVSLRSSAETARLNLCQKKDWNFRRDSFFVVIKDRFFMFSFSGLQQAFVVEVGTTVLVRKCLTFLNSWRRGWWWRGGVAASGYMMSFTGGITGKIQRPRIMILFSSSLLVRLGQTGWTLCSHLTRIYLPYSHKISRFMVTLVMLKKPE